MAMKSWLLWLLVLATSVQVICCQHWSYGLNPGGKRELHAFDQRTNEPMVVGFQQLDKPRILLACGELSPFAKICRMKMSKLHGNAAGGQSGRRTLKLKSFGCCPAIGWQPVQAVTPPPAQSQLR
ncbi:progonadoliberin-1-like [Festucalex cinctus]